VYDSATTSEIFNYTRSPKLKTSQQFLGWGYLFRLTLCRRQMAVPP